MYYDELPESERLLSDQLFRVERIVVRLEMLCAQQSELARVIGNVSLLLDKLIPPSEQPAPSQDSAARSGHLLEPDPCTSSS
jgi:hypothetical protein